MPQPTTSDSILIFPTPPFCDQGFVMPNNGDDDATANQDISTLYAGIGRRLQQISLRADCLSEKPPEIDTLLRIAGLMDYFRTRVTSCTLKDEQTRLATPNVTPRTRDFVVYPCRLLGYNQWLDDYLQLALDGLSMMAQDADENLRPRQWRQQFYLKVGVVFRGIEERIGDTLLKLPKETVEAPDWKLTKEQIRALYKPSTWYEDDDGRTSVPLDQLPMTEDQMRYITTGIKSRLIPIATPFSQPIEEIRSRNKAGSAKTAGTNGSETDSSGEALPRQT